MRMWLVLPGILLLLAGCSVLEGGLFGARREAPPPEPAPPASEAGAVAPDERAPAPRTAAALDTATEEDRARAAGAARPAAGEVLLGTTIASLGTVSEPGFWLRTPLVSAPARGRVEYPAKGTSAVVDLIPLEAAPGAGSRISLSAMRLLEAELTDLPELRVYRLN